MTQVRNGEIGKLGVLFERHHRQLYAFFVRLTGSRVAADDLVQEVFVRLLKYRHTFRGGEFMPWVFRLARNAAADHYSRRRPEDPLPEGHEPAASEPLASETVVHDEEQARLQVALTRLAPEKRELLLLARFQLLPYDEIARLLDTSVGAVKVRVHRALKDLRQAYHGAEEAPI
jgi:RNA polymerase sigma-70 factor (ECF subfamily)